MRTNPNRLILSLIFLWYTGLQAYAQSPNFTWVKSMGGLSHELANSMDLDPLGNIYTTGWFSDSTDFDPGPGVFKLYPGVAGTPEVFISKLDGSGNFAWAKRIGGVGSVEGKTIVLDASGSIYVTGIFNGTVDFDPGSGSFSLTSSDYDIFMVKLDASGSFVWARSIGGTGADFSSSLVADASGNSYVAGYYWATVDFDPGPGTYNLSSVGGTDIFVWKLDASGNFVWAKSMGGTANDLGNAITLSSAGDVYTTGSFNGVGDFDPGSGIFNLTAINYDNLFISKLDASGNFNWAKSTGGTGGIGPKSVTMDASDNLYMTGYFYGTEDFNPGAGTANLTSTANDIFIAKYDSAGVFVWAKGIGGSSTDEGRSINLDAAANVYTTGIFRNVVDFNPGAGTSNLTAGGAGNNDEVFISKLDSAGNYLWAGNIGGSSSEEGMSINVDVFGNIYTAGGYVNGPVDFDPGVGVSNLTSLGGEDIFIHKMSLPTCNSFTTITASSCNSFVFNGNTITASGVYMDTLTNAANCDSIITLGLTIHDTAWYSVTDTACGSYLLNGQTYTTTGTYVQLFTSAVGCDSAVSLNLTIHNASASVTQTGSTLSAASADTYQWVDCNNGFSAVSGAAGQSFTAAASGSYAVVITANGCTDTSACYAVISASVHELNPNTPIELYPNPVNSLATIKTQQPLYDATIRLFNLLGQSLRELTNQSGTRFTIDMNRYPEGVYLIEISEGGKTMRAKIIKE